MDKKEDLRQQIRAVARELGFDAIGFAVPELKEEKERLRQWLQKDLHGSMDWMEKTAEVRQEPKLLLSEVRSVIVLAASYGKRDRVYEKNDPALLSDSQKPLISRYARRKDYHRALRKKLIRLARWMEKSYGCATKISVDAQPVMEKAFGVRAGLGFMGKNTNLIHPRLGSYFFLSCILTTLKLSPEEPVKVSCGSCTRCLEACPTDALIAPYLLDANRCISYLTIEHKKEVSEELQEKMGTWVFGCDICQMVCPFNRFSREPRIEQLKERPLFSTLSFDQLAELSEEKFTKQFAGTPLRRAGRDAFLRNVAIALGNTKDPRYIPLLQKLSRDLSSLVSSQARKALKRLKR